MLGILPEDAFIEIIEGRISVDVVRNNPGPVIAAAVVGGHSANRSNSRAAFRR
ncbi:hypothetical protein [Haloarcula sp. CBA1127]|uniref:hypothetical protein n=1 Tax=Haloarcula sp. CBA1127 TaxID=1765055 RepID=UPI000A65EB65